MTGYCWRCGEHRDGLDAAAMCPDCYDGWRPPAPPALEAP